MIRQLSSGQRIIVLGHGTTMISDVQFEGDDCNGGILFANTGKMWAAKVGDLPPEAVLIQIDNLGGAYAYMRAFFGLLKTWGFPEEIKAQLTEMEQDLITLTEANLEWDRAPNGGEPRWQMSRRSL